MNLMHAMTHRTVGLVMLGAAGLLVLTPTHDAALAASEAQSRLKEQGDRMMKNVEEMMAHGGMGDSKAIVHHCEEATQNAETLKQLSGEDPLLHAPLNEVIRQCRRVSQIGVHADPGMLLNPAIKARAAARESMKVLGLRPESKS